MVEIIHQSTPIARKEYQCSACIFLQEELNHRFRQQFTSSENTAIEKAKNDNWRIMPGQRYLKQFNKVDGRVYSFRAIPEIHDICIKYELYDDL